VGVRINFEGLDELRDGLARLPHDLATKAALVVRQTAEQVGQEVVANYPIRSGNLRRGVRVTVEGSNVSTRGVVRSASPHAHLFEKGTGRRTTTKGANRGQMPKGPTDALVGPRASRARRHMEEQLIEVIHEAGLTTT
jgi:hypothetical protein